MNRIQEIRIEHQHPFKHVRVEVTRENHWKTYLPTTPSLDRLEEIINTLAGWNEGEFALRLYPNSVEVTYVLPLDYRDGRVELSELLG
jgi:hypothetical protein